MIASMIELAGVSGFLSMKFFLFRLGILKQSSHHEKSILLLLL